MALGRGDDLLLVAGQGRPNPRPVPAPGPGRDQPGMHSSMNVPIARPSFAAPPRARTAGASPVLAEHPDQRGRRGLARARGRAHPFLAGALNRDPGSVRVEIGQAARRPGRPRRPRPDAASPGSPRPPWPPGPGPAPARNRHNVGTLGSRLDFRAAPSWPGRQNSERSERKSPPARPTGPDPGSWTR